MVMRDQNIHNQREAQRNMWNLIMGWGLDQNQITEAANNQGLKIEDWSMTPQHVQPSQQLDSLDLGRLPPFWSSPSYGHSYFLRSCVVQMQDVNSRSSFTREWGSARTLGRVEHHSSYFMMSHNHSPSTHLGMRNHGHWGLGRSGALFCSPKELAQDVRNSHPEIRTRYAPQCKLVSALHEDNENQQKDGRMTNMQQWLEFPQTRQFNVLGSCKDAATHHGGASKAFFEKKQSQWSSGLPHSHHVSHNVTTSSPSDLSEPHATYMSTMGSF